MAYVCLDCSAEEYVDGAEHCEDNYGDSWKLLRLLSLAHNWQKAANSFKHEESEADHTPI